MITNNHKNFVKEELLKILKNSNEPLTVSYLLHKSLPLDTTIQFFTKRLYELIKAGQVEKVIIFNNNNRPLTAFKAV